MRFYIYDRQLITQERMDEIEGRVISPLVPHEASTTQTIGYTECPEHGIVDMDPCPVCLIKGFPPIRRNICSMHGLRPADEQGSCKACNPPIICSRCGETPTENYYSRSSLTFQRLILCAGCVSRDPHFQWEEAMAIEQNPVFLKTEKNNAIKEHGCIQERGLASDAVTLKFDAIHSFVRRRVVLDIRDMRENRQRYPTKKFKGGL